MFLKVSETWGENGQIAHLNGQITLRDLANVLK